LPAPQTCRALAAILWSWQLLDCALLTLLGFHCLLRTGEILGLLKCQMRFSLGDVACVVSLPETKGTHRKGTVESVTLTDPVLAKCFTVFMKPCKPGDLVLQRTPGQFRNAFRAACKQLMLPESVRPYSLRRGGATEFFKQCGSIDHVVEKGRWGNFRTARLYVNTAIADEMQLDMAHASRCAQHTQWLQEQMHAYIKH
jgi:hypothetical protein